MVERLTFITSHPKKAEQLSWHLDHTVDHESLDIPEIQSLDPSTVISAKALEAYRQLGKPVLIEDVSLRFAALGRLPGPYIKDFLAELKPEGLCRLLDGYNDRTAYVETGFGLCINGTVEIFSASLKGMITENPRGDTGFGTDAIFVPAGYDKTWGEMDKDEQIKTSVRRIALQQLQERLANDI
jgi:non-canonical purine NTP pyrophosphatase (RdgB/HAM1 family)